MKRVVITGIGAVTPLGTTFAEAWDNALAGRSGIRPFGTEQGEAAAVCGTVSNFPESRYFTDREIRRLDRFARLGVAAALMAACDANLPCGADAPPDDYCSEGGVIIGSGRGGIESLEREFTRLLLHPEGRRRLPPSIMPATTISMASSYSAQRLGMRGYCLGISNACASGTNAVGEAFRMLRSGYPGPLLAGGAEAPLCALCIEGYGAAGALSRGKTAAASRPFAIDRDGFVLAEGSCVLVLESLQAARSRGAPILGEIIGYGNTVDAVHQTRPSSSGEMRAIRQALADAGLSEGAVDCIFAHGTSTLLGDRAEAEAISGVFRGRAMQVPVTAIKSMTGHMLAASGPFEAACAVRSLQEGMLPPTVNLHRQDDAFPLTVIPEATRADITTALVNSFGFGGVNAVLVLKKLT